MTFQTREEEYQDMISDQYRDWCHAEGLDPEDDASVEAYTIAESQEYLRQAQEADLTEERIGMEASYPDFLDYDAVSQGFYDDDPNPYDGTYSEM